MDIEKKYTVIAYYVFTPIEAPLEEISRQRAYLEKRDAKARIYISEEGINGQMSIASDEADGYIAWMQADPRFASIGFKKSPYDEHVFPRLTIKLRPLVALGCSPDLAQRGQYLDPAAWREKLENREEGQLLIDVRNGYESAIGHFEGAETPPLESFREFPTYAKQLKERCLDPKNTPVLMYCTGGIRCELYSSILREEGFERVYQLEGGVINYGQQEGEKHWKGKLFVFDDRLAVPISDEGTAEPISVCIDCGVASDTYYNCASMLCNLLYLSCASCAEKNLGCCCVECQSAPDRRPHMTGERPKPFRRRYNYDTP